MQSFCATWGANDTFADPRRSAILQAQVWSPAFPYRVKKGWKESKNSHFLGPLILQSLSFLGGTFRIWQLFPGKGTSTKHKHIITVPEERKPQKRHLFLSQKQKQIPILMAAFRRWEAGVQEPQRWWWITQWLRVKTRVFREGLHCFKNLAGSQFHSSARGNGQKAIQATFLSPKGLRLKMQLAKLYAWAWIPPTPALQTRKLKASSHPPSSSSECDCSWRFGGL